MISLDASAVLLQWATGGLAFLWVTTRRREVGLGYGWLLRAVFGAMAVLAGVVGMATEPHAGRDLASYGVGAASLVALAASVARRKAGVAGQRARVERRSARITAMTGIDRATQTFDPNRPEFP